MVVEDITLVNQKQRDVLNFLSNFNASDNKALIITADKMTMS